MLLKCFRAAFTSVYNSYNNIIFFRDRLRTCVNVMGDAVGCAFVEAMVERRKSLKVSPGDSKENPITMNSLLNGAPVTSNEVRITVDPEN